MRLFLVVAALILFLVVPTARADDVPSYELPEFVPIGPLYIDPNGDLVLAYTSQRDRSSHFWNADKRQELPDADPAKITHDMAAYNSVVANHHLTSLKMVNQLTFPLLPNIRKPKGSTGKNFTTASSAWSFSVSSAVTNSGA